MRLFLLLVVPLLLLDPLAPGDASLDTSRILSGTDSLLVLVQQQDEVGILGTVVLETWIDAGDPIVRRETMRALNGAVLSTDSFALAPESLAPVYRSLDGRDDHTEGTAFYPNALDLVLAALPLADGYRVRLALEQGDTLSPTATVEVVGHDVIPMQTGPPCDAWTVYVTIDGDTNLYAIDRESRKLARFYSPSEGLIITRTESCAPAGAS